MKKALLGGYNQKVDAYNKGLGAYNRRAKERGKPPLPPKKREVPPKNKEEWKRSLIAGFQPDSIASPNCEVMCKCGGIQRVALAVAPNDASA
jgi:hypothetical protein